MRATDIWSLVQARENNARHIRVDLDSGQLEDNFSSQLVSLLEPYRGPEGCLVSILYQRVDAKAQLLLGEQWRVRPHDDLIEKLREKYASKLVEKHKY